MPECALLPTCLFFNEKMKDMPSLANVMKETYCKGDNSNCARYMVFMALGREKVPSVLFPNQVEKAKEIIAGA